MANESAGELSTRSNPLRHGNIFVMINTSQFLADVESLHETLSLSYMESIVYWCEARGLDVEAVSIIVKNNRVLKAKLRTEAEGLNYIKKRGAKLPI